MPYIKTIQEQDATAQLKDLYTRYANPDGSVDQVLKVHSLNPASLEAHCQLYIQSCHKPSPLTRAEREILGTTVSRLNNCTYCQTHHATGLKKLLPDNRKHLADEVFNADYTNLTEREQALVNYATKLTQNPSSITQSDITALHAANITDQEILDAAQVTAYFAYANRIVLGLGATLESPSQIGHTPKESNSEP